MIIKLPIIKEAKLYIINYHNSNYKSHGICIRYSHKKLESSYIAHLNAILINIDSKFLSIRKGHI